MNIGTAWTALHKLASKDSTRPKLGTIQLDFKRKTATATDGHMLAELPLGQGGDPLPDDAPAAVYVPPDVAKALAKAGVVEVTPAEGGARLSGGLTAADVPAEDVGYYPDTVRLRNAIGNPQHFMCIDVDKLADLVALVKLTATKEGKTKTQRVWLGVAGKPDLKTLLAHFKCETEPATAMVMGLNYPDVPEGWGVAPETSPAEEATE
jgi:hypothetical protein